MIGLTWLCASATTSAKNNAVASAQSRKDGRAMRMGRVVVGVAIVMWLAHELSDIGWREVWSSRPRTLWFYTIWLGLYLQLPVIESLIFRALWGLRPRVSFLPLLHKRTLNQDVVFGLGEASFFLWVRHRVTLPGRRIAGTLKDNLISLTLAAWMSILLLIPFAGALPRLELVTEGNPLMLTLVGAIVAAVVALTVRFRRILLTLPSRTVIALFVVHLARFVLLVYVLQIVQWWVVLPDAPFRLWVAMMCVIMLVNRIAFMPARDLAGISAILGVMALPGGYEATIAAMLLMRTVLDKICNFTLVVGTFLLQRR